MGTHLGFLHPPLSVHQVLEQHNALPTLQHDLVIASSNRVAPPFIIDAPGFLNGFDRRLLSARSPDCPRLSICLTRHLHALGKVEGTESVHSVLFKPHSRSTHTAARGGATAAAPR